MSFIRVIGAIRGFLPFPMKRNANGDVLKRETGLFPGKKVQRVTGGGFAALGGGEEDFISPGADREIPGKRVRGMLRGMKIPVQTAGNFRFPFHDADTKAGFLFDHGLLT